MGFHPAYRRAALDPDYAYARAHLQPLFLDALRAHALDLEMSGTPHAGQALAALRTLRDYSPGDVDPAVPDLFFTLDREIARLSPEGAGALRTALSRNDLDMTVYRLSARAELMKAMHAVLALRTTLLALAGRERDTVITAFTHHQPAQPTTLGHYLAAVENAVARDSARLEGALGRVNRSPLGAVALAGSSHPLNREETATLLGFDGPVENTLDAVAAGDWQVEIAGALSTCAATLSRVVYDLLDWAARGLITLQGGLVQGSSVMPQKRNPVTLEHARTRLSRTLGAAQTLVYAAHNIPFGDVNDVGTDMQEPLWTLWHTFGQALELLDASLDGLDVNRAAWRAQADASESTLTELADVLARRTGDFREAHRIARALLDAVHAQGRALHHATDADLRALAPALEIPDGLVAAALDTAAFVARRTTLGGPAPAPMAEYLGMAQARLEADRATLAARHAQFAAARDTLWAQE
ncbi:argininosuccinate lyase [Deinococcus metalli]|uniref:argininosuccinate lyase n=1 Tax=Deinococcus metalli TaxID=1141878 RepID=A0A7W8KEK1_9DEIO|nr:lyase family protein [Deinococcus metalli]MBB5376735.1 argininosuccinate lyase [Deinococcus metalli]GHF44952.1 argininosuccinate lyase [Deinococcus metalli]